MIFNKLPIMDTIIIALFIALLVFIVFGLLLVKTALSTISAQIVEFRRYIGNSFDNNIILSLNRIEDNTDKGEEDSEDY